jgi:hypothetical protein
MRYLPLLLLLGGCATHEFVIREVAARDVEIVDKEVRRLEREAALTLPRPDAPSLVVSVKERAVVQMMKVRRFTRVERVRRAEVRLHFGAHLVIWTVGWLAGGPIVWYPIFSGSATTEAEYHARTADREHIDKSIHPWEIEMDEYDRATPGQESPIRALGPPTVVEEGAAAGVPIELRLRVRTLRGRLEGEVIHAASAVTGPDGRATFNLETVVREHILGRGLEPILVHVQGGTDREPVMLEGWLRDDELLAAYQGAAVDWKVGEDGGAGKPQFDAFLDKREYAVGETPVIELSLINRGSGPLYRLWARVTSDHAPDGVRPLFVGRVSPGQVVDRFLKLWPIEAEHEGKKFQVRIEFREHAGSVPAAKVLEFAVLAR